MSTPSCGTGAGEQRREEIGRYLGDNGSRNYSSYGSFTVQVVAPRNSTVQFWVSDEAGRVCLSSVSV